MSDQELLDRCRLLRNEIDELIEGAEYNSKYHTKQRLTKARIEIAEAIGSLVWHVEE